MQGVPIGVILLTSHCSGKVKDHHPGDGAGELVMHGPASSSWECELPAGYRIPLLLLRWALGLQGQGQRQGGFLWVGGRPRGVCISSPHKPNTITPSQPISNIFLAPGCHSLISQGPQRDPRITFLAPSILLFFEFPLHFLVYLYYDISLFGQLPFISFPY